MPLPGSAPEVISGRLADPGIGYSLASFEMKGLGDGPVKTLPWRAAPLPHRAPRRPLRSPHYKLFMWITSSLVISTSKPPRASTSF